MSHYSNQNIQLSVLKERAFNFRWAEVEDGIIPLTAADQDFPASPEIVAAITEYVQSGYFCYAPHRGLEQLKLAASRAFKERKREIVNPEFVLPIDSAARGMSVTAKAFLKPGDEVIVFDPVDFLFKTSMESAGAKVILYPSKIKDGHIDLSDLEEYITPKTKMLGLCNPHNPLGLLYTKDELLWLLELSAKHQFYIMNDEVWSDLIYPDGEFHSLMEFGPELNQRTITVYGFSKSFGIAGLRAGLVYCSNSDVFDQIVKASEVDSTIGGIASISQIAAIACLEKSFYRVDEFISVLTENRDYALARLSKMPGITCHKPTATFVLFPNIEATGLKAVDLVEYLRSNFKVALVPGGERFFGPGSEGHIRICLATSHEILKEGLDRLEQGLNALFINK